MHMTKVGSAALSHVPPTAWPTVADLIVSVDKRIPSLHVYSCGCLSNLLVDSFARLETGPRCQPAQQGRLVRDEQDNRSRSGQREQGQDLYVLPCPDRQHIFADFEIAALCRQDDDRGQSRSNCRVLSLADSWN